MKNEIPKIVGYARVSTREQSDNSAALDQQIARLEASGAELVLRDVESGREGKEGDRPNFQQMMLWVKSGLVDKVIITRLDRLSRSLPTLRKVLDEFQQAECVLWALDDNLDISTAAGKFHVNLLGAAAEMESDRLSERIRRGKEHFRKMKRASHAPFGYVIQDYRHVPDREPYLCCLEDGQEYSRADLARLLIEHYISYRSLNRSCRYFPLKFGFQQFWQASLRIWLTSPTLQGDLVYRPKSKNPEIHPNVHEPLMTRDEGRTIRDILAINRKLGGFGSKSIHPFTGLVRCECGGGCIVAHGSHQKFIYYVCSRYRTGMCPRKKGTRVEKIETAAIAALTQRADSVAHFAEVAEVTESPELRDLRSQLTALEQITIIPNRTVNPAISEAIASLRAEILRLEQQRQMEGQYSSKDKELLMAIASNPEFWTDLAPLQKQSFYRSLIDHVLVSDGQVIAAYLKV